MPAVTLKHSTTHSSQNCGVLIALGAETLAGADQRAGLLRLGLPARRLPAVGAAPGSAASRAT